MQKHIAILVLVLACAALASPPVYADDPPPCEPPTAWTVSYAIHETPTDPNSPTIYVFTLSLSSVDGDCTTTAWHIDTIDIQQSDPNGGPDRSWSLDNPSVETGDGLWWVNHRDVSSPQSREFVLTPEVLGSASPLDPNDAPLDFDIVSSVYTPPPSGTPYGVTAQWDITLTEDGGPPDEGTDVPIEVNPSHGT